MYKEIISLLTIILTGLTVIAFYSIPFYFLWNWLMPKVFLLPSILLSDAYGLMLMMYLIRFLLVTKIDPELK